MGNNKPVAKRKKKGRPSLLDLQKRNLRLEKQLHSSNPNPKSKNTTPNPYLKFPNTTCRTTRRRDNIDGGDDDKNDVEDDGDDDEGAPNGKRKEKKLKLVLTIPNGSDDPAASGSDSDGNGEGYRKKRKIDSLQTGRQNSSSKETDPRQGAKEEPSDSGPTTPLPDKKLLEFILDRLQKKDTYAVFSDPVDPEELPDYHDIIKHPMDFTTVRSKLSSGSYACLEQFESDVFLISSNAMRYNAPDTIYYRQARSIQEIAKKDFENLRQESDDSEPEPTVRRGRPPIKNTIKRMLSKTPADRTGSDFSNATLANARDDTRVNSTNDLIRKGSSFDKMIMVDSSTRASHALRYHETHKRNGDRSEYLGSSPKGTPMRNWKKQTVIDENRRDTYEQPILSTSGHEPSVLNVFDWERKLVVPVGFRAEHSYARSLARFAANLGPVAWEIAAKKIERTLPSGTKFGRGWVGDSEAPQLQPLFLSVSPQLSMQTKLSHCITLSGGNKLVESHELPSSDLPLPPSALAYSAPTLSRSSNSGDDAEACKLVNHESKLDLVGTGVGPENHSQICKNSAPQPPMNGFNPGFTVNLPSQAGNSATQRRPPEEVMANARVLNMVSRDANNNFANHQISMRQVNVEEKMRPFMSNQNTINTGNTLLHADHHSKLSSLRRA